jgi:hypothetical protein
MIKSRVHTMSKYHTPDFSLLVQPIGGLFVGALAMYAFIVCFREQTIFVYQ